MFRKILIANRGEIACRVAATARRLGVRTVAVYSDADADARHVRACDEAVHVGAAAPRESYLQWQRIIDAARATGAQAVHPGYGFLSENEEFAQACADAGLVFIGPPATAIAAMGSKSAAKSLMERAGVPLVPGYHGRDNDPALLQREAERIGFPVLIKASAGGGGKGMRRVDRAEDFAAALASCQREAQSSFGDDHVLVERYVTRPRHIEIQVFGDTQGNLVYLFERDCSVQRRHQKVLEEAPAPGMSPARRAEMGAAAVAAARAVGYVGAGTVEFIAEPQPDGDLRFYFMEMNTRLQVEHPVTEAITGLDLVEWQLRVAAGEPLPLQQDELRFTGHAIEVRLYAEDPCDGFKPQTGRILHWRPDAALRPGVRIDHGIAEGGEVTPFYDAMVAKLIAHGRDRGDAIRRLTAALEDAPLLGLRNNGRFLRDLLRHEDFVSARMTTSRLDEWAEADGGARPALMDRPLPSEEAWLVAAALLSRADRRAARPASVAGFEMTLLCDDTKRTLPVPPAGLELLSHADHVVRWRHDGVMRRAVAAIDGDTLHLAMDGAVFRFQEPSPFPARDPALDARRARAPVAGVIAHVAVAVGDRVAAGQPLACVEAMKMEMWLHAGAAGTVRAVHVKPKDPVAAGAVLVELEIQE